MTIANKARSMRRRGSSRAGKNEPSRSFGMRSSTSPALVDSRRGPGAVAMGGAGVGALIGSGADVLGGLGVDQGLQHQGQALADDVQVTAGAQRPQQISNGRLVQGHRADSLV